MFQRPLKSGDVGGTQPQFARAFEQVNAVRVLRLLGFDGCGGAVGRPVVYNEDVKEGVKIENRIEHALDVFDLVVGRYDDNAFSHG